MADAAAANGVPKKIIPHEVAQFTADAVQNPVSAVTRVVCLVHCPNILKHNFYTEFQPEFDLVVEESNGRVLE